MTPRPPWKSLTAVVAALVLSATMAAPAHAASPASGAKPPQTAAQKTVAHMQPGWNLGNTLDSVGADETAWGNPRVTRTLFKKVAQQGFKSVRIPFTVGQYEGAAPGYTIAPATLDRVEQVVDWALDENLYVLLDVHHDSWQWVNTMPTNHDAVVAQFTATWQQLAQRFKHTSKKLLLESINEPQFAGAADQDAQLAALDELNTTFARTVRSSGGKNASRVLVLPSLNTDNAQAKLDSLASAIAKLDDPNIAATFHYYGYWPFSVNIAGGYRFDATAQNDLTDAFGRVKSTLVDQGIPVILGEYGLLGFDANTGTIEQGEKLKFFELLGYTARTSGITTMLWDNGQHLNRTTYKWSDPELFAEIRSSWTTRSGTASTDQVFVRPGAVTAQDVTLNLNGLKLRSLAKGNKVLVKGTDYTVSGSTLTLSAALLKKLSGSGELGTAATLTATFSRGLPWKLYVINATTPVLSSATGTTDAFAIPTQFNGDRLATMEATYADGSFAGPQNWTSYKQFDSDFVPAGDTIVLKPAFFAQVDEARPVTLTFHFWSGQLLTYTVTRTGTSVTGTVS